MPNHVINIIDVSYEEDDYEKAADFDKIKEAVKGVGKEWNAYDIRIDEYSKIVFQTAWAHPEPVIIKLSKMFPDNIFNVGYADEDKGSNLGLYKMKNGKRIHEFPLPDHYNDDTILLAEIMWGADKFSNEG